MGTSTRPPRKQQERLGTFPPDQRSPSPLLRATSNGIGEGGVERTNNTEISRFVCGYDNKSVIFIRVGKTGRGSNKRSGRSLACASLLPPVRLRLRGPAGQQGDSPRLDRQTRQGLSTLPPPKASCTPHVAPRSLPTAPHPRAYFHLAGRARERCRYPQGPESARRPGADDSAGARGQPRPMRVRGRVQAVASLAWRSPRRCVPEP